MKYRLLGRSAMRVSELALGTMTFGEKWGWGASLDESRRMLDLYLDRGGNFVDTASNYTDGQSEAFLGEQRGWTVPSAIQLPYSVSGRDAERELLPMASQLGLAVTVWGVLNGGVLTGKYGRANEEPRRYGDETPSERSSRAAGVIAEVAHETEATPAQVSIAWALSRRPEVNLIPILGARTVKQLEENLGR